MISYYILIEKYDFYVLQINWNTRIIIHFKLIGKHVALFTEN